MTAETIDPVDLGATWADIEWDMGEVQDFDPTPAHARDWLHDNAEPLELPPQFWQTVDFAFLATMCVAAWDRWCGLCTREDKTR